MQTAGLIYGPEFQYLDHLAPLCALLNIPLVVTEEQIAKQAKKFYPDLSLLYWNSLEALEKIVLEFDTIICSTPRPLFDEVFYFAQAMNQKKVQTIWCPHGNSDKGRSSPFMEGLVEEDLILTYGLRIENFLKEKGIDVPTKRIGNYRLAYYQKHKAFYDTFLPIKEKPIILYAPTWQDREQNSSFPKIWSQLLNSPKEFTLLVKLHPHLYKQFPKEVAELSEKVPLIENFPPIYPLLARTDLLIGDKSSIGYDFLYFEKPMIHLNETALPGKILTPKKYDCLFEECKSLLGTKLETKKLYKETFADVKRLDILPQENKR